MITAILYRERPKVSDGLQYVAFLTLPLSSFPLFVEYDGEKYKCCSGWLARHLWPYANYIRGGELKS